MIQESDSVLQFDLSSKSTDEISEFFDILLAVKHILSESHLSIAVYPKILRISLSTSEDSPE